MGFFSYTCAKTHLPVMNVYSCRNKEMYEVVVLFSNGDRRTGEYDGYGRVAGIENVYEPMADGKIKWIIKKFYNDEKFEDLGPSHNDPGQGHFHDQGALEEAFARGGFKTYEEFLAWYEALCQG